MANYENNLKFSFFLLNINKTNNQTLITKLLSENKTLISK